MREINISVGESGDRLTRAAKVLEDPVYSKAWECTPGKKKLLGLYILVCNISNVVTCSELNGLFAPRKLCRWAGRFNSDIRLVRSNCGHRYISQDVLLFLWCRIDVRGLQIFVLGIVSVLGIANHCICVRHCICPVVVVRYSNEKDGGNAVLELVVSVAFAYASEEED